jgi:ectoine hydroxylase-related dioxygenase (phytanoyl-CoA dioxygenase family)
VPVALRYGEALLFDGGKLLHGSVPNESDITRVSMDFRFAPLRRGFEEGPHGILSLLPR